MTKLIVNCETGETIERELNAEELAQAVIDEANSQALKAEADARATARQAVLDRLGLTADEAALLLG
jgi:regulator of protease activity HflC (stomatin/prohibitin superfamily)